MTAPPGSAEPPPAPEDRLLRQMAVGIAALAVVARVWMAWATHSTAEDFLITLRYAENIAAGRGFVYNPGERVLGTTTPLYTLLLALAAALPLNAALVGKAANILADGVTCYLLARLLARREVGAPLAGLFAALLYALSSTPINISIAGMETGLVTCVGLAAITAYVACRAEALYLLGALLFLLRIDGLLLFLLLAAGLAWQERRIPWRGVGLLLLVTLPWLGFAFAYFGSPIPTSFIAKIYVYSHGMTTSRALILDAFATQFTSGWFQRAVTLLFMVGAARVIAAVLSPLSRSVGEGGRGGEGRLGLPLLWLLIYYGTMLASRVPAFPWYFLPPWPLFLGIAALGGDGIVRLIGRRLPASAALRGAWPMALLAFGLFGLAHLRSVRADIARTQWQEDTLRVPMGLWLRAHARPKERILLEPIGYVGYYSQRPILDMIGLVSPEVFVSYRQPDFLADMVRRFRPEWLCLRPSEVRAITLHDSALLAAQYDYIREFHVPGRGPDFLLYHRRQDSAP